jgi:hypothetical protein
MAQPFDAKRLTLTGEAAPPALGRELSRPVGPRC